tara:strand:- start:131 stop:610 length:480 start_codon:yes stop_codon:yes gene_type:complete
MVKDKKREEEKPKKSDFKAFLKKRAPIYLAVIAMVGIYVIMPLQEKNFEKSLPELSIEEEEILEILMTYDGKNGGYTVKDAIKDQISEEYPDEKIFDNKKTSVELTVSNINLEEYQIIFNFKSHKGEINHDWNVNSSSGEISSNNSESKYLINKVNFYD